MERLSSLPAGSRWDDATRVVASIPWVLKFGFSGSRRRWMPDDKLLVYMMVDALPPGATIISGKCKSRVQDPVTKRWIVDENTDQWAANRARERGLVVIEHEPVYPDIDSFAGKQRYWYITRQNYNRNQHIIDDSDVLVAMVESESGGTWDAVKRAWKKGIPVIANVIGDRGWSLLSRKNQR